MDVINAWQKFTGPCDLYFRKSADRKRNSVILVESDVYRLTNVKNDGDLRFDVESRSYELTNIDISINQVSTFGTLSDAMAAGDNYLNQGA